MNSIPFILKVICVLWLLFETASLALLRAGHFWEAKFIKPWERVVCALADVATILFLFFI